MRRRVVITGIGMITPLGPSVASTWRGLTEGQSGVGRISLFDASSFPTQIAGQVLKMPESDSFGLDWEHRGRNVRFALCAAQQAIDDSGYQQAGCDPDRVGVYLGAGEGRQDFVNFMELIARSWNQQERSLSAATFIREGMHRFNVIREIEQEPGMSSSHMADLFEAHGPNMNCLTACAASSQAIGEAAELIRNDEADIMISGGTHSMLHPLGISGFNLLTALSTNNTTPEEASRPFDRDRDGFVLGEGAGMVILEELERAKARGATIYGELTGYGSAADAFRITDTHPAGRGGIAALRDALRDARLNPTDIQYINAHGTSTDVNDRVETIAIKQVFGDEAYKIPTSSIKSMIGHLIAAGGAVELITCLLAIRDGVIPPTINYSNVDPDCDLDYVPRFARDWTVRNAVSNSFGFGGQAVSLVVSRYSH